MRRECRNLNYDLSYVNNMKAAYNLTMLCNWLAKLGPLLSQPTRIKTNRDFPALCADFIYFAVSNSDWINVLFFSVLIDQRNGPFPSCFEPHYESEAKSKVFVMKISFNSYANNTNFHMKSFALSLAFIVRFTATRKWPIILVLVYNTQLKTTLLGLLEPSRTIEDNLPL